MLKFTQKQHLQLNKNKLNEWKLTWNFSNYIPKCVFCAYFRNLILKMKTEKIFSWYIFVHICLIKMSYLWSTASKSTKKLSRKAKKLKILNDLRDLIICAIILVHLRNCQILKKIKNIQHVCNYLQKKAHF